MAKKKSKEKKSPRPPKINLEARLPRPGPISLSGPKRILENARQYPLLGCWIMEGWQEAGLAPVVVARQQDPEKVIFGVYLVDIYCLGVKNALCNADFPRRRFEHELERLCHGSPEEIEASLAHELIYGSIAFAERFGFKPHKDYKLASFILEPAETFQPPKHKLKFGKDGKPFYVSGPYDNARAIVEQLHRAAGEGNYDYLVGFGDPTDF
jgi:hypothetical protein